jgi:WD40 repeat protein
MMKIEDPVASNPFPGLRSFRQNEADRFFGREQQIDDLAMLLNHSPFITVSGESGCGKSSLVKAGLLHRLEENHLVRGGKTRWRPIVLTPGNSPILNLAAKLAIQLDFAPNDEYCVAALAGRLRLSGLALIEAIRSAHLESNVRILIVVDQFEEIFRFKKMTDPEEAAAFVKLILNVANDRDSPVNVILTLRTDQLGKCADFRDLPQAVSRGQYLVPKLTRDQRKEVIVKPVELRGYRVAPRLVQRILNDVSDDYDDLPVMQHVLTRTWQKWVENCQGSREIDFEDYEKAGTADHALSDHADEACDSLTGLSEVVERVFRALTEHSEESTGDRRPLNFDKLCAVVGFSKTSVQKVVDRFRQPDTAFLMPPSEVDLDGNPIIDISHESLIRQWKKLREWVIKESDACKRLKRLVDMVQQYSQDQEKGYLLRGKDLKFALDWRDRECPNSAWVSLYFEKENGEKLLESIEILLVKSEEAFNYESNRKQKLVWTFRGLIAVIVIVSLGAVYTATSQQKETKSRQLVNESLLALDLNLARSAHLALAAIDLDPDNLRAEYALRQSLSMQEIAYTEYIIPFADPISDARLSKDKSRLVVAHGKNIQILDTQNFQKLDNGFTRESNVTHAWLIANNTLLVTRTGDGKAQVQHIEKGVEQSLVCTGDKNSIFSLAISHDEQHIVTGCYNGEIARWHVQDKKVTSLQSLADGRDNGPTITALDFSADDHYLASGDADGQIVIRKTGASKPWLCFKQESLPNRTPSQIINSIAFHPTEPELLATASDNHTANVWELDLFSEGCAAETEKKKPRNWILKHDRPVNKLQFTPRKDNKAPLMTVSDKRVFFWSDENSKIDRMHNDWVKDVGVSDDAEFVVSASSDGTARIWFARSGIPIATLRGHRDEVTKAFFSFGNQVITTSWDKTLRVWRFQPEKVRLLAAEKNRWLLSAAFDSEGQQIAICGEDDLSGSYCSIVDLSNDAALKKLDSGDVSVDGVSYVSWSNGNRFLTGFKQSHSIFNLTGGSIFWDSLTGKTISSNKLGQVHSAKFYASTDELVTVGSDGNISVWDTGSLVKDNSEPKSNFTLITNYLTDAVMSPDGRWIAAFNQDEVMLLNRNLPKSKPRILTGHHGLITAAKFSHDSQRLVTASKDRTARIWHINNQEQLKNDICTEFIGHTAALSSATFNPSGTQVATSSADNTIRVWNTQNCQELTALYWHSDSVNEVMFSPDGQSILSVSDDGTAILSRCETCNQTIGQLLQRAKNEVKLPLDELERLQNETNLWNFKLPFTFNSGKVK